MEYTTWLTFIIILTIVRRFVCLSHLYDAQSVFIFVYKYFRVFDFFIVIVVIDKCVLLFVVGCHCWILFIVVCCANFYYVFIYVLPYL